MGVRMNRWTPGRSQVAVVMIALNEAHNMEAVLRNLAGWAREVFLVDSCSSDDTVEIALRHGVHVVQHPFRGFGDQWNFALTNLPITAPWTMKLDPDERLGEELKAAIDHETALGNVEGLYVTRRLWFMNRQLPVSHRILRVWRTGACRFTDVVVNEHPLVEGTLGSVNGVLEHHDSPDLDHWITKQNKYTTAEALRESRGEALAIPPRFWGTALERRMWWKQHFWKVPGRFFLLFLYHWLLLGAWRSGRVGWIWAHLRTEVYRWWEYKKFEIDAVGERPASRPTGPGVPDPRVPYIP